MFILLFCRLRKWWKTILVFKATKGGNKRITQGWIANVITDKLGSKGDVSHIELRKWNMGTLLGRRTIPKSM